MISFKKIGRFFFLVVVLTLLNPVLTEAQVTADSVQLEYASDTLDLIYYPLKTYLRASSKAIEIGRESREFAATFQDPSRVLYRVPGVSLDNDQNNSISYRGIPPEYVQWSFYGAEIVNPNHLTNAGRISDESSPSSGGVLGIPFDVIHRFSFYGSPASLIAQSSSGSIADFNFSNRSDSFIKLGLLGMEAAIQTEGRFETKAHFRYSFVGLLGDLGVDFDGESIKFYDGFVRTKLNENLSVIVSAGRSTNDRQPAADSSQVKTLQDLYTIRFRSQFFIAGLEHQSANTHHALFYSRSLDEREAIFEQLQGIDQVFEDNQSESEAEKVSYAGSYNWYANNSVLKAIARFGYSLNKFERDGLELTGKNNHAFLGLSWEGVKRYDRVKISFRPELGLQYLFDYSGALRVEPSFFWELNDGNHYITFKASRRYRRQRYTEVDSKDLIASRIDRNDALSLEYRLQVEKHGLIAAVRAYKINHTHPHFTVEYLLYRNSTNWTGSVLDNIWMEGQTNRSKGIEWMLDKSWGKDWHTQINYGLLDVRNVDEEIEGNFDFGYTMNAMLSKLFHFKNGKTLLMNMAYHGRGGMVQYFPPETFAWSKRKLGDYKRLDLRLEFGNDKSSWILDIQNVAGFENEAYYYFDAYLDRTLLEKQLGTIPVLSYKRVF